MRFPLNSLCSAVSVPSRRPARRKAGLKPGGDENSYFQIWQEKGGEKNENLTLKNVIAVLPGKNPEFDAQSVVICAHYDHLGLGWPDVRKGNEGKIHFGADDNASGVAGLLEIGRLLGQVQLKTRVVLVAFALEEPPFFRSNNMGSAVYAKSLSESGAEVKLMIALEMIGYFSNRPNSQTLPFGFNLLFPDAANMVSQDEFRGNFITNVGN